MILFSCPNNYVHDNYLTFALFCDNNIITFVEYVNIPRHIDKQTAFKMRRECTY